MRALVQRVSQAAVFVEGEKISSIGQGLLLFLGVVKGDSPAALQRMVHKVANLRIFSDQAGKMNLSVKDVAGEVLVVSQFTLAGELNKGFRPSFANAEEPLLAKEMYQQFCDALQEALASPEDPDRLWVSRGRFAADMQVQLINDGPVTIWLDYS